MSSSNLNNLNNLSDILIQNASDNTYYIMEYDPSINTLKYPHDIWNFVFGHTEQYEPWNTDLAKRFYLNIIFGDNSDFPPIAKKVGHGEIVNFKLKASNSNNKVYRWTLSGGEWSDASLVSLELDDNTNTYKLN